MDLARTFLYFIIYSFFGWLAETIYCSFLEKKFVYRGFLNGPICPIYGFGSLFILLLLKNLTSRPLMVFVFSLLITSVLEYFTSYILESFFNMKWWDYSQKKFNINGRVCALNSSLFGLLSLVLIYLVHPRVSSSLDFLRLSQLRGLSLLFLLLIGLDSLETIKDLLGLDPIFKELESKLEEKEKAFILEKSSLLGKFKERERELEFRAYLLELEERKENFKKDLHRKIYQNRLGHSFKRILKSYPNLKSRLNPDLVKNIKKYNTFKKN